VTNKVLVCQGFDTKPLSDYQKCNFEFNAPRKVYVRQDMNQDDLDILNHGLISLSDKFGTNGKNYDVFELFGTFEEGAKDVIFSDTATKLEHIDNNVADSVDEALYRQLHCM
jgi:hypothetical protein